MSVTPCEFTLLGYAAAAGDTNGSGVVKLPALKLSGI